MMKIGPDGSFPRITSSFKGVASFVKIVEVPEDQRKDSEPFYKLVWNGPIENESESEKSEEEPWPEEDISNFSMPAENIGAKVAEPEVKDNGNKPYNELHNRKQFHKNKRQRNRSYQNNYNVSNRSFNNSDLSHNNYNNPINQSNTEEINYPYRANRSFDSRGNFRRNYQAPITSTNSNNQSNVEERNYYNSNRNFDSPDNFVRNFKNPVAADDINPWVNPPSFVLKGVPVFQRPHQPFLSVTESHPQSPSNLFVENVQTGILGNSPFSPNPSQPPNFPLDPSQPPNFPLDPSQPPNFPPNFPPPSQNDAFGYGQGYYDNDYDYHHQRPNSNQRPRRRTSNHKNPNRRPISGPPMYKKFHPRHYAQHDYNSTWKQKKGKHWNNERRNTSHHSKFRE